MSNIVKLIIIGALIVAIPVTVKLVQQQQILKSKAALPSISDNPPNAKRPCDNAYTWKVLQPGTNNAPQVDAGKYGTTPQVNGSPNACAVDDDCPENAGDKSNVDPTTSNWCYQFEQGTRCIQLQHIDGQSCPGYIPPGGGGSGTCNIGGQSPDIGATCAACLSSKTSPTNVSQVIANIKNMNPTSFSTCSNQQILNNWCNGFGATAAQQCNELKTGVCAASCGGSGGSSKDIGGSATACNGNVAYPGNGGYAVWNGQCSGALQAPGSGGIGQSCCESSICGADPQCDEQTPGQGNCTADCKVKSSTPERRDLCVSTTVSPGTVSAGGQLTITSTSNESKLRNFRYAFYNRDNGTKIICQQGITSVVDAAETARQCPNGGAPLVIDRQTAANATSNTATFNSVDLRKPDTNWNSQIPTNFQVNGYFIDQFGLSSTPNTNCSKPFDIAASAPPPPPPPCGPGVAAGTTGCVPSNRMPGDADDNRCVNVDDYSIWKQEAGVGGTKICANWTSENPSTVDTEDYGIWYRAWKVLTNRQGCITPPAGSRCIDK